MKQYRYQKVIQLYEQLNGYKNIHVTIPDVSFLFKRFKNSYHGIMVIDNTNAIVLNKTNLDTIKEKVVKEYRLPSDMPMNVFTIVIDSFKVSRVKYIEKNVCALDMVSGKVKHNMISKEFHIEESLLLTFESQTKAQNSWVSSVVSDIDRNKPVILTVILMIANILSFIIFYVNKNDNYGISSSSILMKGESYRLFTYMFLHAGVIHLLSNSIALLLYGNAYERRNGSLKLCTIYLFGGVYAGIISILVSVLTSNLDAVTVGASGAIFAILGAYVVDMLSDDTVSKRSSRLILIYSIYMIIGLFRGNVDVACHIGGFMAGFVLQKIFMSYQSAKENQNYVTCTKKVLDTDMRFMTKRI